MKFGAPKEPLHRAMKRSVTRLLSTLILFVASIAARGDTLYVAEEQAHRILQFTGANTSTVFSTAIITPNSFAVDVMGNVYASDYNSGIYRFTAPDSYTRYGSSVSSTAGLALDTFGNLYVADAGRGKILKYTAPNTFTEFATGLNGSFAIALDNDQNLYVNEYYTRQIRKFTAPNTSTVFATGIRSFGLDFDANGDLFASDIDTGTIRHFTAPFTYTTYGSGFANIGSIAFDSAGHLFATDFGRGTIREFSAPNTSRVYATGLNAPRGIAFAPQVPAQKIYLAWGTDVPVRISAEQTLFGSTHYVVRDGTMAATSTSAAFQLSLQQEVQAIFSDSGISNITFVSTPSSDATSVYFTNAIDSSLAGKAYTGVDRFNSRRDDKVAILLHADAGSPSGFNLEFVAETVAHELGHSLGLRHVNPGGSEIMDYNDPPGTRDLFTNTVSHIVEPPTSSGEQQSRTHNPQYHLQRYVDGQSHSSLVQQGIEPGTWDQTFFERVVLALDFGTTDLTLFDVFLLSGYGDTNSMLTLAHFDSISLSELEAMQFEVGLGSSFELFASSSLGGALDTVLALGDPFSASNTTISVEGGASSAFLQRHSLAPQGYTTVSAATVTGIIVPEPSSIVLILVGGACCLRCRSLRTHERNA